MIDRSSVQLIFDIEYLIAIDIGMFLSGALSNSD